MAFQTLVVLIGCFVGTFGTFHFSMTDCGKSSNKALAVSNVHLSADPVRIPGDESITADVQVMDLIDGDYFKLDVDVKKKFLFTWIHAPCFNHMGSCTYDNICDYLSHGSLLAPLHGICPLERVPAGSAPVNCTCPLTVGSYHLNVQSYHINKLSGLLSSFVAGDYKIDVHLTDKRTNEQVVCLHIQVTTTTSKREVK